MEHSPTITVDLLFTHVSGELLTIDVIIIDSTHCSAEGVALPGHPLTLRLRTPEAGSAVMQPLRRWTACDEPVGVSSGVDPAGGSLVLLSQHETCVALELAR